MLWFNLLCLIKTGKVYNLKKHILLETYTEKVEKTKRNQNMSEDTKKKDWKKVSKKERVN
jgi:hypothetical protein